MKKVEAIIQPVSFEKVKKALEAVDYPGITVTEVEGHGKQKGITRQWRGRNYKIELLPKVKVEIVIPDQWVERIVLAIQKGAQTGQMGDGKIFVSEIAEAYKISSGEKGVQVVS
jgi:nitrogen regulatory protein P-II 1